MDSKMPLYYNVSHSGRIAALAVSLNVEVGIDVERIEPGRMYSEIADYALAPSERRLFAAMPQSEVPERFVTIWARKEAVIKCVGGSSAILLDAFSVSTNPDRGEYATRITSEKAIKCADICNIDEAVTYRDLPMGIGYRAAVAWRSEKRSVTVTMRTVRAYREVVEIETPL